MAAALVAAALVFVLVLWLGRSLYLYESITPSRRIVNKSFYHGRLLNTVCATQWSGKLVSGTPAEPSRHLPFGAGTLFLTTGYGVGRHFGVFDVGFF